MQKTLYIYRRLSAAEAFVVSPLYAPMAGGQTILVVEDEVQLRALLAKSLQRQGYRVVEAAQGEQALHQLAVQPVDLVLLDLRLPQMDGLAVCQAIRRTSDIPIVILTSLSSAAAIRQGLEVGADEYITKPFHFAALLARLHALLRRAALEAGPTGPSCVVRGDVVLYAPRRLVRVGGQDIRLTVLEGRLLQYLMLRTAQPVSVQTLLQAVWGYAETAPPSIVYSTMHRLRQKLEPDPQVPRYLVAVWGTGYKFQTRHLQHPRVD